MSSFLQPINGYPPTSLLLFLQSAPPPLIFLAFQADCNARGIQWYSTEGQLFAVNLFLKHPVSHRYPPRPSTLRSFLKQYISLIEQPHIMTKVMEANDGLDDPIQLELMEAFIALNMLRNDAEPTTCYKSFFNPYLTRNLRRASSTAMSISNSDTNVDPNATLNKRERERLRRERHDIMDMFCPVRVSTEQFRNVGLSLWPAAFVLVQLLAQEMKGTTRLLAEYLFPHRTEWDDVSLSSSDSHDDVEDIPVIEASDDDDDELISAEKTQKTNATQLQTRSLDSTRANGEAPAPGGTRRRPDSSGSVPLSGSDENSSSYLNTRGGVSLIRRKPATPSPDPSQVVPEHEKLHVLELGAGVGLTPIFLHRIRAYRQYVANFTITDYQARLTENISANLKGNKVTTVSDYEAARHGLEGADKTAPFHLVSLLDWNDDVFTQQSQLLNWRSDVVLAADCIYDVDVIPGLVRTIKTALTMRYSTDVGLNRPSAQQFATLPLPSTAAAAAAGQQRSLPQRRLSRHATAGFTAARRKADGDATHVLPPYDSLLSSSNSPTNSAALDLSYDFGIDFAALMPAETAATTTAPVGTRSTAQSTRTPSLRSPLASSSSLQRSTARGESTAARKSATAAGARPRDATGPSDAGATAASTPSRTKKRVCIVVQTHRQASTMKVFFDAVREFAKVESFVLERMPVLTLESQLSKGRDCRDGGVVPVGDYNPNQSTAVFENRDRWVCALRPDVVLPDGNLKSVVTKTAIERAEGRSTASGAAATDIASWPGSTGSMGGSAGGPTGSATASWSAVSSFTTFTTADMDALLKDEMIGPFFTSMAGLIGVHIITLKQ